jgi:hypothetical protein
VYQLPAPAPVKHHQVQGQCGVQALSQEEATSLKVHNRLHSDAYDSSATNPQMPLEVQSCM